MIFLQFLFCCAQAIHLAVFVHGIGGDSRVLGKYAIAMQNNLGSKIQTIHPSYNSLGGVDVGSDAVIKSMNLGDRLNPVTSVSFIGHSFGGIVSKEVVRKLKYSHPDLQVKNFITLATPHLGSRHHLPKNRFLKWIGGLFVRFFYPQSHRELIQVDKNQVLEKLSNSEILKNVKNLHNYANVEGDSVVAHSTSAITGRDVMAAKPMTRAIELFSGQRLPTGLDKKEQILLNMQKQLKWNTWNFKGMGQHVGADTHMSITHSQSIFDNILGNFKA